MTNSCMMICELVLDLKQDTMRDLKQDALCDRQDAYPTDARWPAQLLLTFVQFWEHFLRKPLTLDQ